MSDLCCLKVVGLVSSSRSCGPFSCVCVSSVCGFCFFSLSCFYRRVVYYFEVKVESEHWVLVQEDVLSFLCEYYD